MRDDERRALEAVSFDWAPTPSRVWQPPEAHVTGLNEPVYRLIKGAFRDAGRAEEQSPLGIVVEGEPGSGKTHLLSWTRKHVQEQGGYFLLAGLTRGREFWPDIVHTFIQDLNRTGEPGTSTQLQLMLERLADRAGVDQETGDRVTGRIALTPPALNTFERAVRRLLPGSGRDLAAVLRALTMMAADDADLRDIGEGYLRSRLDDATREWAVWRLTVQPVEPRETAELISQLLAQTGPAVLAFDQIDTIFAQSRRSDSDDSVLAPLADQLGSGLMDIRQVLRRTVLLVACLSRSWDLIQEHAVGSVPDRFRRETQLDRLPSAEVAKQLVASRLHVVFKRAGFQPEPATWPVPDHAFEHAREFTPRMLLQRVDWHIRACLRADAVLPLADLRDVTEDAEAAPPLTSGYELGAFDERLAALVQEASVDAALSPDTEDTDMPPLLVAALQAWVIETGNDQDHAVQPGAGNPPIFHAMLRHFLDPDTDAEDGSPVSTGLESLRKHVAIFAGSGSGKTVLIRRLIEECALRRVSSIVLDPNNDLARLGDPWPEPPVGWGPGDAELAAAYLEHTEVIVWTPRRQAGRPLVLQPLPDLTTVLDDPDDLAIGLDIAVAALAPRARLTGNTARTDRGRAILREALSHFAHRGGGSLKEFIDLLADLPEDVASLERSVDIASDMAQTLTAACINDPLFGGSGTPLDPGVLLTPSPNQRARISVISMIGLSSEEQRQSFVSQLQMGLMTWIKAHPARDRPLSGLLVMDEAQTIAPSGPTTAATESTLALAGLIKATAQIVAVRQLAQGRSSEPIDVSGLGAGTFYLSDEGAAFRKVSVPMSLSHHPPSALSAEEVLARARR